MDKDNGQNPINSAFGAETNAEEIIKNINLEGKNVIVTGGYSGIGLEVTKALSTAGANIFIPVRNINKGQKTLEGIKNVKLDEMDLMDGKSIDNFTNNFLKNNNLLHILINGAGVMAPPLRRDSRGYESQFSTNHLGHFYLTARLWPALVKANGARVLTVSSRGHRLNGIDFDDPNFERREYDKWKTYAQSKSANVLFALELDKRGRKNNIRAFSVHSGMVPNTSLGRDLTEADKKPRPILDEQRRSKSNEEKPHFKTVQQGAATILWCALSSQLNDLGGVYCEDCNIAISVSYDSLSADGVRPWAIDPELSRRLWELSERLIGMEFKI
ncbi:oxidoreductase [Spirochaetia bacterium]|nr:oxidoreductase [Spirochaetia bacterium]GHU34456.1 oxidoreductase [Spirochaetia bacterium]